MKRESVKSKKGISAVVATVLIILITVAAVSIVWAVVIPMIKNNISAPGTGEGVSIDTSNGYTVYDSNTKIACVQVKRESGEGIVGAQIIFDFSGNSETVIINSTDLPEVNQRKTYCYNLSEFGEPTSIKIAPISIVNGKQTIGAISTTVPNAPAGTVPADTPGVRNDVGGGEEEQCTADVFCGNVCANKTQICTNGVLGVCTPVTYSPIETFCGTNKVCNGMGVCIDTNVNLGNLSITGSGAAAGLYSPAGIYAGFEYFRRTDGAYYLYYWPDQWWNYFITNGLGNSPVDYPNWQPSTWENIIAQYNPNNGATGNLNVALACTSNSCDDENSCTNDICSSTTGVCGSTIKEDGESCGAGQICSAGVCQSNELMVIGTGQTDVSGTYTYAGQFNDYPYFSNGTYYILFGTYAYDNYFISSQLEDDPSYFYYSHEPAGSDYLGEYIDGSGGNFYISLN